MGFNRETPIYLNLEVLAHGNQNFLSRLVGRFILDTVHLKGQGDGEIEGVVGRLVDDDELMSTMKNPGKSLSKSTKLLARSVKLKVQD